MKELLIQGAAAFGAHLTEEQVQGFYLYMETLKRWNQKFNLTAIENEKDIIIKHFIDSLSMLPYMEKENASIIDVGTGAGFPGIPLKLVRPNLKLVLLDSLEKRVGFLKELINILNISDTAAIHGRAEDYGVKSVYREVFDISTARAVASLPVLLEYCLPFTAVGGVFIAMKGSNADEAESSDKALKILGGEIERIDEIVLPFSDIKRRLIIVRKLRQTPTKYPRKSGKPSKEPLK